MAERPEVRGLINVIVSCADEADGGKIDARAYAKQLVRAVRSERNRPCQWTVDDSGLWHTACGDVFRFEADGPRENRVYYCQSCGAPVKAKKMRQDA